MMPFLRFVVSRWWDFHLQQFYGIPADSPDR
jgi:hypothetical protein